MTGTRFASIVTLLFVTGVSGSARAASPAGVPAPLPPTQTTSSSTATLHGSVIDERGQALAGALVSVTGEQNAVTVTDGAGHYVFAGLPQGPYLVRVHQRGFTPARALLADPRILILDEATSSVDIGTERTIEQALRRLLHGRTAFIIAHRLSTIREAGTIVVLEIGRAHV